MSLFRPEAPSAPAAADASGTMASSTTPLVVLSNRLPFAIVARPHGPRVTRGAGGLVTALDPVLAERGGVWVGWSGAAQEASAPPLPLPPAPAGVSYRPVPLAGREVALYYEAFSNRTLWPLFHTFVGRTHIDGAAWRVYDRVNERFARAALDDARQGSLAWVHDYHLLRVPHHLRRLAPEARIAFFLHIPFPADDVIRVLPWARALLGGMLAADLVGFHVPPYVEHFLACAERLLGCEVDRATGVVRYEGRAVAVQAHPIGIDVAHVERLAAAGSASGPELAPDGVATILGVDRLDYTKGIHERLLAIERLLERHPPYRRRIVFTQVLVPSRERVAEYNALKRDIDETVGRINGRFSEPGWSPIRYLVRSLPHEELVPLYRRADVALVTPLRDGMNLVAKEYVAAQTDDRGVLILSELAGAAEELQEAVVVNPFDVDAVAEALDRALSMPADERRARMSALRDRVRGHDVYAWVHRFLAAAEAAAGRAQASVVSPTEHVQRRLAPWLAARPTVALFLDYDGTLTPIAAHPEEARLSEGTREVLSQAARAPNLDVVIVSGRALADVRAMVGVAGLTYVGNHGFEIEGPGLSYRHEGAHGFDGSLQAAARELQALGIDGAWVEEKGATLAYHVRGVPDTRRRDVERRAAAVLRRHRLRVTTGKRVVEGRPSLDWHKGHAVQHVLVQRHGADWPSRVRALYIGDDVSDEDAFHSLRGIGRSIYVAAAPPQAATAADYRVPDPVTVVQLLRWLASGGFRATAP